VHFSIFLQIDRIRFAAEFVHPTGSIECGDRADGRGLRRREEECLPQRLETPIGSVDPDDDASEYGHASTLRQRPLRLPVILRRKPLLVDALL
jgi:hypothetical protein